MIQRCAFSAQKASLIPSCIKSSMASRLREETLPSYSALLRHHLDTASSTGVPSTRRMWACVRDSRRLLAQNISGVYVCVSVCLCEGKEQVKPCLCRGNTLLRTPLPQSLYPNLAVAANHWHSKAMLHSPPLGPLSQLVSGQMTRSPTQGWGPGKPNGI